MKLCPKCKRPCPDNEWVAYGRHEDCAVAGYPDLGQFSRPRVKAQPARGQVQTGVRRRGRASPRQNS